MDRIDEWRVFAEVATAKSFVAAARAHGRSPQAITRAVAALEARLGTRLLHRTTRSVSLTSSGERYLERGRRVVAELDELEGAARSARTGPLRGRLSITAPVLFGQLHVAPIVLEFMREHALVDVRLVLLDRVVSLADEGIDLGVRIGALPDSALRARVVGHVRTVACASPAYLARAGRPRAPSALAKHQLIAFTATTPIVDRWTFGRAGVRVQPRLTTNTGQAAIDAAVAGAGIVRAMSYQVAPLVAAGKLAIVLARYEPEPVPVQLVQLPGIAARVATVFADYAAARLSGSGARGSATDGA
ncbi:MAG TPA: LysR family transcriptional regulator [Kofleriaceae bacterium]|jgi:DNA-binding transcriptional LysR family regulator